MSWSIIQTGIENLRNMDIGNTRNFEPWYFRWRKGMRDFTKIFRGWAILSITRQFWKLRDPTCKITISVSLLTKIWGSALFFKGFEWSQIWAPLANKNLRKYSMKKYRRRWFLLLERSKGFEKSKMSWSIIQAGIGNLRNMDIGNTRNFEPWYFRWRKGMRDFMKIFPGLNYTR